MLPQFQRTAGLRIAALVILVGLASGSASGETRQPTRSSRLVQPQVRLLAGRNRDRFGAADSVSRRIPARFDLPLFGKVNPGPFAIWQDRRFERGETHTGSSRETF